MVGWVQIHRQLLDSPFWTCEPFTRGQAWIDLIGLTNHADNFFYCRGIKVDVKRGQCGWSEVALAQRWKWSRSKLRKFLNDLEKEQQIIQHKNNVSQLVTLVNYDIYQEKEQQTEQQKDSRKTAERQQKDTNKNDKNENNENNDENISVDIAKSKRFVKPTIQEIEFYCNERKNIVDAVKFFDFYESKGWKIGNASMKDWRAAIRTWEKSEKTTQNGTSQPSRNGSYN